MKSWILWMGMGVVSVLGGILALANPLAASVAAEQLAGWIFLTIGMVQIFAVFRAEGSGSKVWAGLVGLASVLVGISLLSNPLAGVISLTLIIAILFLCTGAAKIIMSFSLRRTPYFLFVMLSGVFSVILAVLVFSNFPVSAMSVLGVLLAIELISNGVSLISIALKQKSVPEIH